MEALKEALGGELYSQVKEKLNGKEVLILNKGEKAFIHKPDDKVAIINDGSYIPIKKWNDEHKLRQDADERLARISEELDTLKKLEGTTEEMKKQIATLEAKHKDELLMRDKTVALKDGLIEAGAKRVNAELLMNRFDLSKFKLDENGKIVDFDKILDPVKKDYAHLFGQVKLKGTDPNIPTGAPDGYITKEQFLAMDEAERQSNIELINKSSVHWSRK